MDRLAPVLDYIASARTGRHINTRSTLRQPLIHHLHFFSPLNNLTALFAE